ncbi:hypothetical protein [Flavobacterium sp. SORGH_AS_0622]|uniref:hypothetical protein n=1 Tax=Flavobacterium sp. SORGH_AS_0622 TaxID=3041772 RepID=UPI00278A8729|nr:hypothetical protein [Flavobacterium sp. SORGH_AS_0622]MDQ1167739.1 hypothetical protein [Flavobacterium sp. SORGH_AS_0622]
MSELSSLFSKLKITKAQLENFLKSAPEKPTLNDNWQKWWDSREMYSKMDLTPEYLRYYNEKTNQEVLDGWMEYKQAMAFSDYDEAKEEWQWGLLFFSENYVEMLPMLAFIVSMEKFVTESTENRAIVYPYFWGDSNVDAYIYFENGKAVLSPQVKSTSDVNVALMENTIVCLDQKWEDLSKNMEMD